MIGMSTESKTTPIKSNISSFDFIINAPFQVYLMFFSLILENATGDQIDMTAEDDAITITLESICGVLIFISIFV